MSIVAKLIRAGVDADLVAEVADAIRCAAMPSDTRSGAAKRQQRYRDAQKDKAESVTKRNERNDSDAITNHNESVTKHNDVTPLAHVRDKPLTSVLSGLTATETDAREDDWPEGSIKDHAAKLVELSATSRLDMAREGGLTTSLGQIHKWKLAGASWEFDVVPVVTTLAAKATRAIKSWVYFRDAITDSVSANRQALTIPEAPNITPIRPGTGPPSLTDKMADDNRKARELAFAELDRRDGRTN